MATLSRGKECVVKKTRLAILGLVLAVALSMTGLSVASARYIVLGRTIYVGSKQVSWADMVIDHTGGGVYQYNYGFHRVDFTLWNKAVADPRDRGTYGAMWGTSIKQMWFSQPRGQGYYLPRRVSDIGNVQTARTKNLTSPSLYKAVKAGAFPVGYSISGFQTTGQVCYDVWLGLDKCTAKYTE